VEWIKLPTNYTVRMRALNTSSVQYHCCRSSVYECHSINGYEGSSLGCYGSWRNRRSRHMDRSRCASNSVVIAVTARRETRRRYGPSVIVVCYSGDRPPDVVCHRDRTRISINVGHGIPWRQMVGDTQSCIGDIPLFHHGRQSLVVLELQA
jgi:hypothetical protein